MEMNGHKLKLFLVASHDTEVFQFVQCTTRTLERGKLQESPSKIYGAHILLFQAQISNFIAFGPEMAQRNGLKVFGLDWPFLHFSLILRLKSG